MKYSTKTKLYLEMTLDSSEAVMFGQGGKMTAVLTPDLFDDVDEVEISFQIDRQEQARYDFVTGRRGCEGR